MKITPEFDDAPDFVTKVEQAVNGIIRRHAPETIFLIKIDNFFGSKWLGFSGKFMGALGSWHKPYNKPADDIRIPPFVPSRVVSQRRFAAPSYEEIDCGEPIHKRIPSRLALRRKAAAVEPRASLLWYSGDSKASGRGSVMAYVSVGDSYWPWYAALEAEETWRVTETWDIKREDLSSLLELGSGSHPNVISPV
jgi:hypothetical protein